MTEGQASKAINPTPTYPAIGRSLEIPGGWKVSKGKKIKAYEAELDFSGGVGGSNQKKHNLTMLEIICYVYRLEM